jgi:ribosome biogenesis GTPase
MDPLERIGFDAHFASAIQASESGLLPGRAVFESRGIYHVLVADGRILFAELKGILRKGARADQGAYPVVGDWVLLEPMDSRRALLVRALPRKNCLIRREQSRREAGRRASVLQILAANVDWGFITTSLNEEWNPRRLERYLALVRDAEIRPAILLTKADVCDDPQQVLQETKELAGNIPVFLVSGFNRQGLPELVSLIAQGQTAVLIGSSGVGKSTLVNALLGDDVMATAEIREKDSRGRHTTVARHLLPLPNGGCIIDSPGLRDLGLVDTESVEASFDDIEERANACRFSDCRHQSEPGCAVRTALEDGTLNPDRWENYQKLLQETQLAQQKIKGKTEKNTKYSKKR